MKTCSSRHPAEFKRPRPVLLQPKPVAGSAHSRLTGMSSSRAFTVLELLIVLAIIGLVMALSLPHLGGMRQSNIMASANRQLSDDLALARQRAISGRSTVYVLFMGGVQPNPGVLTPAQQERLLRRQFTSYALFAERTVGDQPGRPTARYLTPWKDLPEGVFIAKDKFLNDYVVDLYGTNKQAQVKVFDVRDFPYPSGTNANTLPFYYVGFDPQGRLISTASQDGTCIIPLARGSITHSRGPGGLPSGLIWDVADARESPLGNSIANYNHVVIDGLLGRTKVERPTIK